MGNQNNVQQTAPGAIPSMVCGIVCIVTCCLPLIPVVLGIIAIVFFVKTNKKIKESGDTLGGKGMGIAGLVTGIVGLAIGFIYQIYWIALAVGFAFAAPFGNMFK